MTDYGLAIWAKEIDKSIYILLLAVALGVDAAWLREVLKAVLTRTLGVDGKDRE